MRRVCPACCPTRLSVTPHHGSVLNTVPNQRNSKAPSSSACQLHNRANRACHRAASPRHRIRASERDAVGTRTSASTAACVATATACLPGNFAQVHARPRAWASVRPAAAAAAPKLRWRSARRSERCHLGAISQEFLGLGRSSRARSTSRAPRHRRRGTELGWRAGGGCGCGGGTLTRRPCRSHRLTAASASTAPSLSSRGGEAPEPQRSPLAPQTLFDRAAALLRRRPDIAATALKLAMDQPAAPCPWHAAATALTALVARQVVARLPGASRSPPGSTAGAGCTARSRPGCARAPRAPQGRSTSVEGVDRMDGPTRPQRRRAPPREAGDRELSSHAASEEHGTTAAAALAAAARSSGWRAAAGVHRSHAASLGPRPPCRSRPRRSGSTSRHRAPASGRSEPRRGRRPTQASGRRRHATREPALAREQQQHPCSSPWPAARSATRVRFSNAASMRVAPPRTSSGRAPAVQTACATSLKRAAPRPQMMGRRVGAAWCASRSCGARRGCGAEHRERRLRSSGRVGGPSLADLRLSATSSFLCFATAVLFLCFMSVN